MAKFSYILKLLESPVHGDNLEGCWRVLTCLDDLPLLTVVYGRTWETLAQLLPGIIMYAMYSLHNYVLHGAAYLLTRLSMLSGSQTPSLVVNCRISHTYQAQVQQHLLFLPSLLTLQNFFQPCWDFLTLAAFLVLWRELGCLQIQGLREGTVLGAFVQSTGVCVSLNRAWNNSQRLISVSLLRTGTQSILPPVLKYVCISRL